MIPVKFSVGVKGLKDKNHDHSSFLPRFLQYKISYRVSENECTYFKDFLLRKKTEPEEYSFHHMTVKLSKFKNDTEQLFHMGKTVLF